MRHRARRELDQRDQRLSVGQTLHPRAVDDRDCRHTAVSLALADGTPVKVVQEMAGHSSPAITQGTYAHVMPGQHEAAGARLSGLLGASV